MKITGADQLIRLYFLPNPKIHPILVLANHPTEKHIDSFASGFSFWGGDMLSSSLLSFLILVKLFMKISKQSPHDLRRIHPFYAKCCFQAVLLFIKPREKMDKIKSVNIIEGPVFKPEERFYIILMVIDHKIIRGVVHHGQKLQVLVDYGFPLAPCQGCCNKSSDFNILLFRKAVGDGDGIQFNKAWLVI